MFVDDAYRTEEALIYGEDTIGIRHTLPDGSRYRIVKMTHTAAGLRRRLAALGWEFDMRELAPFFRGVGRLAPPEAGRGERA